MTREELMEHLYRDGRTLEEIGRLYSLSRERIRQILEKRGVPAGIGRLIRTEANATERWRLKKRDKDHRVKRFYGCDYDTLLKINNGRNLSDASSPSGCYKQQRMSAARRGIKWAFTLPEWWSVWVASGKWEFRGRGKDAYCMARRKDNGPYWIENVHVITNTQNIKDGYITKPARKRREAIQHDKLTPRQKAVAKLAGQGLSPIDIGETLGVKSTVVQQHLCAIRRKLGLYERQYGELLEAA